MFVVGWSFLLCSVEYFSLSMFASGRHSLVIHVSSSSALSNKPRPVFPSRVWRSTAHKYPVNTPSEPTSGSSSRFSPILQHFFQLTKARFKD